MNQVRRYIFLVWMLGFAACGSDGLTSVKVLSPDGIPRHEFQAELALTNAERSQGLMFIGTDKKIVSIVENAAPQTTNPRSAEGPYQYVLEVEGGRSTALGIKAGDSVVFEIKP